MNYLISPISKEDREPIMDIFNYYIEHSFAAYPEQQFPYAAFDMLLQMSDGYPTATLKNSEGKITGFGMLRAHNPMPAFSQTAEITYFIHPEFTGQGLGKILLSSFEKSAKQKGISCILASISSLNSGSINFHKNNGFIKCGQFNNVARKNGRIFDVVWMQKIL